MTATTITVRDRLGELDWLSLPAGAVVQIPWRKEPYREKVLLSRPATLRGLPGPDGQLPVLDFANATTDQQFQFSKTYRDIEDAGGITIHTRPGQKDRPANIAIEGLHLRGATDDSTYTTFDGLTRKYSTAAAAIYGVTGDDVSVRNCVIEGNRNGVLVVGGQVCRRWLIEDGQVFGNGKAGSDKYHNLYCEVLGMTYRRVRFGGLVAGALGAHIHDRSCGTVIDSCEFVGPSACVVMLDTPDASADAAKLDPGFRTADITNCLVKNTTGDAGALVMVAGRGPGAHVVKVADTTFDIQRSQGATADGNTYRVVLLKTEATDPINFLLDGNLIRFGPAATGGKASEVSVGSGRGWFAFGPNWSSPGLLQCRTGIVDGGTYAGWFQVEFPPTPEDGFGQQVAPAPVPPTPDPLPWTEVKRSRFEDGDTAVETVLYRRAAQ